MADTKPLKLVLKVGGMTPTASPSPASMMGDETPERKIKHKKKKKHKKRRREEGESDGDDLTSQLVDEDSKLSALDDEDDASYIEPPSIKKARIVTEADYVPGRSLRERKSEDKKGPLYFLLDYMQKNLQKKDGSGIFAFPVTDMIAPRYSEIVKRPMDFSTMRRNIDSFTYKTVAEYREDFKTMLQNCMLYNHPDTIYFKEAQRLLGIGLKQLSKDRVMSLKRSLPSVTELSDSELGESDEDDDVELVEYKSQRRGQDNKFEAMADHLSADDVLAQVQAAAQSAADLLKQRKPKSKIGYLRREEDGTTCLNFLNPDNDGIVSEKERVVTLGSLAGKVKSGSHTLAAFREDKRNKATPVSYLTYGSFSSYAPVFDSTTANISKEESDLLLSTYADETGIQYSKSIRHFVEDCGDYAVKMVDNMLDILTQGQHSQTLLFEAQEEEKRRTQEVKEETLIEKIIKSEDEAKQADTETKSSALESVLQGTDEGNDHVQKDLDRTSELLKVLQRTQQERLGARLTPMQPQPLHPSESEAKLAREVTESLTKLTKCVRPEDVVSKDSVRNAMGIEVTTEYVPISPEQKSPPETPLQSYTNQSSIEHPPVTFQISHDSVDSDTMNQDSDLKKSIEQSQGSVQSVSSQGEESDQPMTAPDTPAAASDTSSQLNSGPMEVDETAAAVAGIL